MLEEKDVKVMQAMVTASRDRIQAKLDELVAQMQAMRDELKQSNKADIDASEIRMQAYFEGAIMPKFDLMLDGYQDLREKMAPKSRIEALEDEMVFMKSVVKALSQEVAELKKAQ